MKNILVIDSSTQYTTYLICKALTELYGGQAEVMGEKKKTIQFDRFFVSAKLILDGFVDPQELKRESGTINPKVIVMSVNSSYLDELKNKGVGDFFHDKDHLVHYDLIREDEKMVLLSYLNE